jgi:cell fate regulator YaaT (PSP1 superfamily)
MTEIIGVRFKPGGKQYYFDPQGLTVQDGDGVIVETGKGLEYGACVRGNVMVEDAAVVQPLRPVIRLATNKDLWQVAENKEKEEKAMKIAQKQIERHGLDMKLVSVEYCFDGSKIVFFFTSDGRVDFRALVKDLAGIFRARIELRQIGVRDEARMLGGLGICGKPFCCAQFLDEFQPVSIKMAKTQNLSLNPTKISGACGRLMCCLKYEQDAYEDAVKRVPKQDSFVECPDGVGTVSAVNLLKEQVKVRLDDSTEQPKSYYTSEIRVIRSGKGKRPEDYVAPPPEELEKLRYIPPEEERASRRFGDAGDLSAALEQYLGTSSPAEEEEKKSATRRRRGRGKGVKKPEGQPAAKAEPVPQPAPSQPRQGSKGGRPQPKRDQSANDQPRKDQGRKEQPKKEQAKKEPAPSQPRKTQTAPQPAPAEGGEAKPANKKRHYRPRNHRPKKPAEGGGPTNG